MIYSNLLFSIPNREEKKKEFWKSSDENFKRILMKSLGEDSSSREDSNDNSKNSLIRIPRGRW